MTRAAHLARTLRTVRHLRPRQILGQVRRLAGARVEPRQARGEAPRLRAQAPCAPYLPAPRHAQAAAGGRVRLLNRESRFPGRIPWDFDGHGPLWAYHLHQMEWLRCDALPAGYRRDVLLDWIERHPRGTGWDGGPTSIRAFVWAKLLTTPAALPDDPALRARLLASLADQLATLSRHLETHLLGNHYLWNLLALGLGGVLLDGSESEHWRGFEAALFDELEEQVLADGAHYERSPMYHALLLENLLDLLNLARAGADPDAVLVRRLSTVAGRMLGALRVFTHPDGEIALVGDTALGVAQPPERLHAYARALGVAESGPSRPGVLDHGGYVRLEAGPYSLLASVAGPMPSHQPGHAHCDALAFELCVEGERVVTDTGVYEYAPGPRRDASRATRSHATIEVGGRDQAELWGAHRVGGRPQVRLESVEPGGGLVASCRSWSRAPLHRREIRCDEASLRVVDRVDGPGGRIALRLPLAPGLEVRLDGPARAEVAGLPGSGLQLELPGEAAWSLGRAACFPEFGRSEERPVLEGAAGLPFHGAWMLRRGPRGGG